jgi:hypothetical protein
MGFTENIEKARKAKREEENPTPEQPKKKTIKEILRDKEQSRLFMQYLDEAGEDALVRELIEEKPADENFLNRLNERQNEFLDLMSKANEVSKLLDIKSLEGMAASSPELQKVAEVFGFDGIRDAAMRRLPEIAINDRPRFDALYEKISGLAEAKKNIEKFDEDIKIFCKDNKIDQKQYEKLITEGNYDDWHEAVRAKMGFWEKFTANQYVMASKIESIDKTKELNELIEDRNEALGEIGGALQMALMDNPTMHSALIANLKGRQPEKPEPETPLAEAEKGIPMPEQEESQKAWEKWQDEHENEYMQSGTTRDEALRDFSSQYARGHVSKWSKGKRVNIVARVM